MSKVLTVMLLCAAAYGGATVIKPSLQFQSFPIVSDDASPKSPEQWKPHIMDFLKLIDGEKVVTIAFSYIGDPEVLNFITFLFSPNFKELIWEFESMDEFKEAFYFLESKGYDVKAIIDFVNKSLKLPPFGKDIMREKKGISGMIEDIIDTLPMDDMKELFEEKLKTIPEIKDLFETINSKEFLDIMKRLSENPKFEEFKGIFESFGFDFSFLCKLAKEIFGDYYQGIFCPKYF